MPNGHHRSRRSRPAALRRTSLLAAAVLVIAAAPGIAATASTVHRPARESGRSIETSAVRPATVHHPAPRPVRPARRPHTVVFAHPDVVQATTVAGTAALAGVSVSGTVTASVPDVSNVTDAVFSGLGQLGQQANAATNTLFGLLTNGLCGTGIQLLCDLSLLQFTVHSVYEKPGGGEFVGNTVALLDVPTLVDVTGDGLPDLLVTVGLTSLNTLSIHIAKTLLAPATLPASVEIVVKDPTNTSSSSKIAVGYDQRTSSIPTNFSASATLTSFSPLEFVVTVTQAGADAGLTLTTTMFELAGNGTRTVSVGARAAFVPAPASMSYDILLDSGHQHLTYTAKSPTTLTADLDLVDGSGEQTYHALVDQLPAKVDLDMVSTDDTHRSVTYNADGSVIKHIAFQYQDITHASSGDLLTTEVTGDVQSLPSMLTFKQDGPSTVSFAASGGAVGVVAGGIAHLQHVLPVPSAESGARITTAEFRGNSFLESASARLLGLTAVSVQAPAGGPYFADLQSTTQPLHIVYVDYPTILLPISPRVIDVVVADLPAHLTLGVDPDAGTVAEDGHGQGIDLISVDATSAAAFFGKAKHLHVDLHGIPAAFTLKYTAGNGGVSATLTDPSTNLPAPISSVDFFADDGAHAASVPAGFAGLTYHDQPGVYAMAGRVYALSSFTFSTDASTPQAPMTLTVDSAGGVFKADVALHLDDGTASGKDFTLAGTITSMPTHLTLTLTRHMSPTLFDTSIGAHVSYAANAAISSIDLDATESPDFLELTPPASTLLSTPLVISHVHVTLVGVPAAFEFDTYDDPDGGFQATVKPALSDHIDFYLDDGQPGHTVDLPGRALNGSLADDRNQSDTAHRDSGLTFYQIWGVYMAVAGRIYGFDKLVFHPAGDDPSTQPMSLEVGSAAGHVFDVRATMSQSIDESSRPLTVAAEVDTLPADLKIFMWADTGPHGNGTMLQYQGTDGAGNPQVIDRIEAFAEGPQFLGGVAIPGTTESINVAHFIYAKILHLPSRVTVAVTPQSTSCVAEEYQPAGYLCSTTKPTMSISTDGTINLLQVQALDDPGRPLAPMSTWSSYDPGTDTSWQPASSTTADGIVYHDLFNDNLSPAEYTLALQLSGLQSASMSGSGRQLDLCDDGSNGCFSSGMYPDTIESLDDLTKLSLSVDPAVSQPFNVDMETQAVVQVPTAADPLVWRPAESARDVLAGFINKPQPNMNMTIHSVKDYVSDSSPSDTNDSSMLVDFGANGCAGDGSPCSDAGTAIPRLHLERFQLPPLDNLEPAIAGSELKADVAYIPNQLRLCFANDLPDAEHGSTDTSGCLKDRSRPSTAYTSPAYQWTGQGNTYPLYPPDEADATSNPWWHPFDANHLILLNVDDYGTSGSQPMIVNAFLCTKTLDPGVQYSGQTPVATCDTAKAPSTPWDPTYRLNGPGAYVKVSNLSVHNLLLDMYAEKGSGLSLSGHLGIDTRSQPFSGQVTYFDQSITVDNFKLLMDAFATFPPGFYADYRYTNFDSQDPVTGAGKYSNEWGFVPCNSSDPTNQPHIGVNAYVATPHFALGADIGPRFLCHVNDTSKPNPWYATGQWP